ncbi:TPA: type II toxin-antitoxin system RelE/ParE family toxin [Mannheimia haemolytica]
MVRLVISPSAKNDIAQILKNVGEYTGSSVTVSKLRNEFLDKFEHISYFPRSYKLLDDGTRQAFCRRYRIIYKETENGEIQIITVIHSLRKYP